MSEKTIFEKLNIFGRKNKIDTVEKERRDLIEQNIPKINEILNRLGKLKNGPHKNSDELGKGRKDFDDLRKSELLPLIQTLGITISNGNDEYPGDAVLYQHQRHNEINPGSGDWEYRNEYVRLVKAYISDTRPGADGLIQVYQQPEVVPIPGKVYKKPE